MHRHDHRMSIFAFQSFGLRHIVSSEDHLSTLESTKVHLALLSVRIVQGTEALHHLVGVSRCPDRRLDPS
jgi:hypothetical protein